MRQNNYFDKHWTDNFLEEIPDSKKAVAKKFLSPVLGDIFLYENICILEGGCGDGVHSKVIKESGTLKEGSLLVGMDVSMAALRVARQRTKENRMFICGDISKMPFSNNQFDMAFSYGVLAYTQDPFKSFSELCRVVKPGGRLGIWMASQHKGLGGWLFRLVRKICRATGPFGTRMIGHLIVPFLVLLPTNSKVNLSNANWQQCLEVVLVNISPENLYFPDREKIISWFEEKNISIISQDEENPITVWGRKSEL